MSDFEFTEEEIRDKLAELGYTNVPREKLREFADDLRQLMRYEKKASLEQRGPESFSSPASTTDYIDSYITTSDDQSSPLSGEDAGYRGLEERGHRPIPAPMRPKTAPLYKGHYVEIGKENKLYAIEEVTSPSASETSSVDQFERPKSKMAKKRKVMRRKNGEARVFDESFTSTDSASTVTDISELEQQLRDLPLRGDHKYDDILQEPQDYRPWEGRQASKALPSYIRPSTSHPHTRGIKKIDPVNRYHQFKYEWEHQKAPGEKNRNLLRWNVRGQMLQQEVYERPQRRYAPNNYVVPTEKKRQSLRWQVRTSLARA
ncbi:hydrolethalus syndrome protein 1 homolog [Nematostella vectensis]|uniref:hydrolethalus syndrome protein 1 homolog n=1 Tax=Nematostella vectensis TaxID=45351 RepID=UPI002076EBAF|nr:hydrolethalus syndrome protein 1 homolog [Nematostella vectensis]